MNKIKNDFDANGYYIFKNFWDDTEIADFHEAFDDLISMQSRKLGLNTQHSKNKEDDIIYNSIKLENHNRNAYNQLIQMQREMWLNSATIFRKNELFHIIADLLGVDQVNLKVHQDGCLVNFPKNDSRLYRFHSEQNYYPLRKSFVNVWFPLVRNKTINNGTMTILPKGHLRDYNDFVEFSGFNSKKSNAGLDESETFYQLDIPDVDLEGLTPFECELNVGDMIIFHQNLPHKSNINNSELPSFAYILRVYSFMKDRTLSNYNGIKRYSVDAAKNAIINPKF